MHLSDPRYLDYAATTPLDVRVAEAMCDILRAPEYIGNPASAHQYGWQAQTCIKKAQQQVAAALNAHPKEIVWTSGATESNNLAIKGAAYQYADRGRHVITMQTEHASVMDTCKALAHENFSVTYLPPQKNGLLDLAQLQAALQPDTILVSVMHVNNETGVIQDIPAIAKIVKAHGALLHVDAAQSMGKVPLNVQEMSVDFMSLSAHKVYGPKGIGALYVRRFPKARLQPLIHGGSHQQGLRSGTLPTHQIVGMGLAFALAQSEFAQDLQHISALNQQLITGLSELPGVHFNGAQDHKVPGIVNVSFESIEGESLLSALEPFLAISNGAACTSTHIEPSRVLTAMGLSRDLASNALRISFGRFTTSDDIAYAISHIRKVVLNQ